MVELTDSVPAVSDGSLLVLEGGTIAHNDDNKKVPSNTTKAYRIIFSIKAILIFQ